MNKYTQTIDTGSQATNKHTVRSGYQSVGSIATRRYVTGNSKPNRKLSAQIKKLKVQNQRLGNRLSRVRSLETLELNVRALKTLHNYTC